MPQETVTPVGIPPKESKPSISGIVAILLVLALLIIGALYFWGERLAQERGLSGKQEAELKELQTQSNSTDPASIEADLEATSPDEFSAELDAAYEDLDSAFEE